MINSRCICATASCCILVCALRFSLVSAEHGAASGEPSFQHVVSLDREEIATQLDARLSTTISGIKLDADAIIDLNVARKDVAVSTTQFVVGRMGGPDEPISTDVANALVLQGRVAGSEDSFVFLTLSESGGGGVIDIGGAATARYRLSSRSINGSVMPEGQFAVERISFRGARRPETPLCGVTDSRSLASQKLLGRETSLNPVSESVIDPVRVVMPAGPRGLTPPPMPGPRVIDLAVETDHELFQLFGDTVTTASYVAAVFSEVSAIYERDFNARVELTFVRVWDHWDDLFNQPDPLSAFRSYWNNNMQAVPRDVAQFFSGRRDLPYGGVAYLGALCGGNGYGVTGYALGVQPDPQAPSVFHYDILVAAHELGHNVNAPHTHSLQLDDCFNLDTPAQRGTIMSYCSQTVSGGNAVSDLRFHSTIQTIVEDYLDAISCLTHDCNGNGIADEIEIIEGGIDDDGNGVLDACEDCNANLILDTVDITNSTSFDVNMNGIPDECEPDCNANSIPDATDIASMFSRDEDFNNVPDECQADCDSSGGADCIEILADMTLDIDRDAILDSCQDCDHDGVTDLVELDNAHSAWLAGHEGGVRAFHAATGVVTLTTDEAQVNKPNDVLITPDGRVLVTSGDDHRIVEFDRAGLTVGNFVPAGSGGLANPTGITRGANGNVFVASSGTDAVLEYELATGAFVGSFVTTGAGGLEEPFGLEFGPNGNLFVTSGHAQGQVLEFDGTTGAFIRIFVADLGSGGLTDPRGMAFKPDGNLLVASFSTRSVLEYNGSTGNLIRKFNNAGTDVAVTTAGPWGVRIGPDGQVYVSRHFENGAPEEGGHDHGDHDHFGDSGDIDHLHVNSTRIYMFDALSGNFIRSYVTGNDTGLRAPTGFDFFPGWDIDCNNNHRIDSCDISLGSSVDTNTNNLPDECERDCNANGVPDYLDIWPNGASFDCNNNGVPDSCDIVSGLSRDCNGDNRPDECELITVLYDNFERDRGWTSEFVDATGGHWERGGPVNDTGWAHDPVFDADFGGQCWLTENSVGNTDVDNGSVILTSPLMDMSEGFITISYEYFLRLDNTTGAVDRMLVEISSNGAAGPWETIATHVENGGLNWRYHQIDHEELVAANVALTSTMQMRFTVNDASPQSIVEAGLDTFQVTATLGATYLNLGDMNCDCTINGLDIAPFVQAILDPQGYADAQQQCDIRQGDFDQNGSVDESDIEGFVESLFNQ